MVEPPLAALFPVNVRAGDEYLASDDAGGSGARGNDDDHVAPLPFPGHDHGDGVHRVHGNAGVHGEGGYAYAGAAHNRGQKPRPASGPWRARMRWADVRKTVPGKTELL